MRKTKYWYKIDNAGKIFPAVSKYERSNVFRLSFYIHEDVDPILLEETVQKLLPRFETFAVQMRSGFFWNYLSENNRLFKIHPEIPQLCHYFRPVYNQGYLFRVYYLKNKITMETFHTITDGFGALAFLKAIVYHYLKAKNLPVEHEGKILSEKPFSANESEDAFVTYYDKTKKKSLKEEKAFRFKGESFNQHWSLMAKARINSKQILKLVKEKYQATITQYVCAVFAYAVYQESTQFIQNKKPFKLFIPVNLRSYFKTKTLRNFSLYIKATYPVADRNLSFEEILALTKEYFKDQLDKEKLQQRLSSNVGFEKNMFIRFLPLVLKNIVLRIGYNILAEEISTSSISNLGVVDLPLSMKPYVLDCDFVNGGYGMTTTLISLYDHTNIILNTSIKDLSIMHSIFNFFVNDGLDITLTTNYLEGYDEIL
ncbi:MAG: hypothetical protein WC964_03510 [Acholeplasmataceae bacterium]